MSHEANQLLQPAPPTVRTAPFRSIALHHTHDVLTNFVKPFSFRLGDKIVLSPSVPEFTFLPLTFLRVTSIRQLEVSVPGWER